MPKLTAEQAYELAVQFNAVAQKLATYRFSNWSKLTPAQRSSLEGREFTIRNYSSDFTALSIQLDVANLEQTLASIKSGTTKMKTAVTNLKTIGKIIKVATIVITIGAAVMSGNPTAIASAVGAALAEEKKG